MKIKDGTKVKIHLSTAHGQRFFDAETAGNQVGHHDSFLQRSQE